MGERGEARGIADATVAAKTSGRIAGDGAVRHRQRAVGEVVNRAAIFLDLIVGESAARERSGAGIPNRAAVTT